MKAQLLFALSLFRDHHPWKCWGNRSPRCRRGQRECQGLLGLGGFTIELWKEISLSWAGDVWAGDVEASVTYLDIPSKPVVVRNISFTWESLLHWCARMNVERQYCALSQNSRLLGVLCLEIASAREFTKGCRCSMTLIRFVPSPYVNTPKISHDHDLPQMLALNLCPSIFCAGKYNQQARSTHSTEPLYTD